MRVRISLLVVIATLSSLAAIPGHADDSVVRESISFAVTDPASPGTTYTINGTLIRPRAGCTGSVLLAMHGLSYGAWAWDFPLDPDRYSVAQAFAERGYATVTVDELGYGASAGAGTPDHPNGYSLSVEAYADIAAQIAKQLRMTFAHVGIIGHSAGSEIAELAVAENPGLFDVLIPTAYTHEPFVNNNWLVREWSQDNVRAAQSDYEYFETDPYTRATDMYNLANADGDVVAWDTAHAALTPSGEIFSIGTQPSRFLLPSIQIPVLLVLGDRDTLFPASFGGSELQWFQGTTDKRVLVAPGDGHVFMLQRNAHATDSAIADWLDEHSAALPGC